MNRKENDQFILKACAHAGVPIARYVEITALGVEKNYDLNLRESDVRKVVEACGL